MLDLFVAQKFDGVMEDWGRFESRSDHVSLGTLVAIFFAVRLYLRIKHGAPPLQTDLPAWQARLAQAAHWALYGLIGALVASGVAAAINANSPISPFGLFVCGDGMGNADLFAAIRAVHEWATQAIIVFILVHIGAALFRLASKPHRHLTVRVLRFWRSEAP